jgi:3-methyl-2-oxobutanoate hydroxymethyltransferase
MAARRKTAPRRSARPVPAAPAEVPRAPAAAGPRRAALPVRPKVTCATLQDYKRAGRPIVMVTAYDYPFARIVDAAGVDVILVGDSLGMVVLGFESTLPVTLRHILHHVQAVMRARPRALVVADMPFMSFQVSPRQAVRNAGRLLQQGGAEAVKLEGGERVLPMVEAIARADIPVLGHLGLTPQSVHHFGGYRVQGRTAEARTRLRREARQLQDAGCFGVVLEAIPAPLAAAITAAVSIPTIGIGAGGGCDGQVLVLHDLLALHDGAMPRFVQRFADVGAAARAGVEAFAAAVRDRQYPRAEHEYGG